MESEKCHLSGIIIRDLSTVVSNYRSSKTLDEYLKEQGVLGEPPHQCDIAHSTCRPGAHVYATSLKQNDDAIAYNARGHKQAIIKANVNEACCYCSLNEA